MVIIFTIDINQEGFPISVFLLPILRLLDSNKDIWMDSNQVYNLIQVGWNNLKRTQGSKLVTNTHAFIFFYVLRPSNLEGARSHQTLARAANFVTLGRFHSHKVKPFFSFSVNHSHVEMLPDHTHPPTHSHYYYVELWPI